MFASYSDTSKKNTFQKIPPNLLSQFQLHLQNYIQTSASYITSKYKVSLKTNNKFLTLAATEEITQKSILQCLLSADYPLFQVRHNAHSQKHIYEIWFNSLCNFAHFSMIMNWHKNRYSFVPSEGISPFYL